MENTWKFLSKQEDESKIPVQQTAVTASIGWGHSPLQGFNPNMPELTHSSHWEGFMQDLKGGLKHKNSELSTRNYPALTPSRRMLSSIKPDCEALTLLQAAVWHNMQFRNRTCYVSLRANTKEKATNFGWADPYLPGQAVSEEIHVPKSTPLLWQANKRRPSFNHKFTNIPIHLDGRTLTINQLTSSLPKEEIHKENGLTDSFCFFVQVTSIKEVSALKMVPWRLLAWKNARANCQFSIPKEPPGYEQAMKTKLKKIFSQNY